MKERIWIIIKCLVMLLVAIVFFNIVVKTEKNNNNNTSVDKASKLVVYGDNVDKSYVPLIENNNIFISYDTIEDFIDDTIFWDKSTNKIIIATEDYLYKFSKDSVTKNLQNVSSDNAIKFVEDNAYINSTLLKEIYNIKCEYEEETSTVAIDNKTNSDIHLNYNEVRLYSNIRTDSDILEILNTDNTVVVYVDSLNHSRC